MSAASPELPSIIDADELANWKFDVFTNAGPTKVLALYPIAQQVGVEEAYRWKRLLATHGWRVDLRPRPTGQA